MPSCRREVVEQVKWFSGPVWRLIPATAAATHAMLATASEGRFHHSGQKAAYASLSIEGTAVAIKRYLRDGVPRVLVPMWLDATSIADERGNPEASIVWQTSERPACLLRHGPLLTVHATVERLQCCTPHALGQTSRTWWYLTLFA